MKNIHGREQLEIQLSNELAIQEIVQISKSGLIRGWKNVGVISRML